MKNALTIDLEDYYHVSAFNESMPRERWSTQQGRVDGNTNLMLDMLDEAGCKATFFTLGCVAQQHPQLVRRVSERGHEVACHSLRHHTVYKMTQEEFLEDTRQAKQLLEDSTGMPVCGYRAPSFSITRGSLWALDVLVLLGFTFDSSIFPVGHPKYGIPNAPRDPHRVHTQNGSIVEFPPTTLNLGGWRAPFAGGAYFRFLPYSYTRWGIQFLNRCEQRPVCVYLHPWEIDPEQPRMNGSLTAKLRHYTGLKSMPAKFRKLITDFEFGPLGPLAAGY